MAETLAWMFKLDDKFSGPGSRVAATTTKLDAAFKKLEGGSSGALSKLQNNFKDAGQKVAQSGSVMKDAIATALGGIAKDVVVGGLGLAKAGTAWVLDSLMFKENTVTSLEAMLGSKKEAEALFAKASKFASVTPFSTSQVAGAFEKLTAAGFRGPDLEKMMKGVGDLGVGDPQKMDRAITALSQIQAKGKTSTEELMQLAEMGVPLGKVYESLAKTLGKSTDEIQKMMQAGKITSAQGIEAVMETIRTTLSGGELGGKMQKASNSLAGLISTMKSAPEDLLFSMGDRMAPMIEPIKELVKKITASLGPDAPLGQLAASMFENVGMAVGIVADTLGHVDFGKWIERIVAVASQGWPMVEKFFAAFSKVFTLDEVGHSFSNVLQAMSDRLSKMDPKTIERLGTVVGYVALAFLQLLEVVVTIGATWATIFDSWLSVFLGFWSSVVDAASAGIDRIKGLFTTDTLMQVGIDILAGLAGGITAGAGAAVAAAEGAIQSVIDAVEAKLDMGSPSRVMGKIGHFAGLGFIQEFAATMNPELSSPQAPAIPSPAVSAVANAAQANGGGFGGAQITITVGDVHVTVDGTGKDGVAVAKDAAANIRAQLGAELRGVLNRAGG